MRKVGHMHNFYANLLNKNVAFGSGETKKEDLISGPATTEVPDQRPGGSPGSQGDDEVVVDKEKQQAELVATAAKAGVHLDKYDLLRMEAERALKARGGMGTKSGPTADLQAISKDPALEDKSKVHESNRDMVPAVEKTAGEEAAVETLPTGKRRNDDSSVQSARERYLARKKVHS